MPLLLMVGGGPYDKALKYIEKGEELIKRFQGDVPEEIKGLHTGWLWFRTVIYVYKGNLALNFKYANELLRIANLYDHKRGISDGNDALGRYYWLSGDLDSSLVHFNRAISLGEEILNDFWDVAKLTSQLGDVMRFSIVKGDIEAAKKYFKHLEEIRELKPGDLFINNIYRLAKAFLLKSSMRFRDRVMAEDLFKEIIEDAFSIHIYKLTALSELCELFLVELGFSNNINIISELKPLLEKLISMAQPSGLYYFLIEAYILHGKLALITFDIESSR